MGMYLRESGLCAIKLLQGTLLNSDCVWHLLVDHHTSCSCGREPRGHHSLIVHFLEMQCAEQTFQLSRLPSSLARHHPFATELVLGGTSYSHYGRRVFVSTLLLTTHTHEFLDRF